MADNFKTKNPPEVTVEEGWEVMHLPFNIGSGRTVYSGLEGDGRLRLRLYKRTKDNHVVGRVWFGPGADGPPGHAHGGVIAYVLDEAMGSACWANDYPAVAAKLEFQLMRMSPLHIDFVVDARIVKVEKRRVHVEANIRLPTGEVCVMGMAQFAILSKDKIKQLDAAVMKTGASEQCVPESDQASWGALQNPNLKWATE